MAVKSILMVCRGNICRSPMAEVFFAHQLKNHHSDVNVHSAGIAALVNNPAEAHSITVMNKYGLDLSKHRGKQLTSELVKKSDLIFVMTESQYKIVQEFMTATGKTFLLGHWQNFEIQDPYTQPYKAFERVYQQIELAWQDWKPRIL